MQPASTPVKIPNPKFIPLFQPNRRPVIDVGGEAVLGDFNIMTRAIVDAAGIPVPPERILDLGHLRTRYYVYWGGRGGAKCLALGTKVIMADGSLRAIEDVLIGEAVMGPDSKPRHVLDTTRGHGPLYRVQQTSGMEYVVNEGHILSVKKSASAARERRLMPSGNPRSPNGRYPSWPSVTNIPVEQYAAQSQRWRAHFRGYRAGCLQFPKQKVLIDPYFLGLWLGDGTGREMRITAADDEILEYCRHIAETYHGEISIGGKPGNRAKDIGFPIKQGRFNPLWDAFKAYELPNNKHIPQAYLANSEEVRLQLLAGILDTDAHCRHNGYVIAQVNERLARDIKFLADGLGFRTSISSRATLCSNNGVRGTAFYVHINGDTWRIPCRLPRKQIRREEVRKNKDFLLSDLTVTPAGDGEWAGFALDGDHLFLLEDGTVTHNSWTFAQALVLRMMEKKIKALCCREIQSTMADSVYSLIKSRVEALGITSQFEFLTNEIRCGATGSVAAFRGLRHNINELKSFEDAAICWVEEAGDVSEESWDKLDPTIRSPGAEIWVGFNTELESDPTYVKFVTGCDEDMTVVKVHWYENPELDAMMVKQALKMREKNRKKYDWIWGGEAKAAHEGGVFVSEMLVSITFDKIPVGTRWARGWDLAGSEIDPKRPDREPPFTAGVLIGLQPNGRYVVANARRTRGKPEAVEKYLLDAMKEDAAKWRVEQSIPQDPGQAGKHQVSYFAKSFTGHILHFSVETGDKVTRAEPFAAQVNAGNVDMVTGPWNEDYKRELDAFPGDKHNFKDLVDASSRAFARLLRPQRMVHKKLRGL